MARTACQLAMQFGFVGRRKLLVSIYETKKEGERGAERNRRESAREREREKGGTQRERERERERHREIERDTQIQKDVQGRAAACAVVKQQSVCEIVVTVCACVGCVNHRLRRFLFQGVGSGLGEVTCQSMCACQHSFIRHRP